MKYAFVFPGQGSQFVGMGKDLADNFASAREVFDEVNEALGQNLFKLMTEGPENELMLTANTQPALMAHSLGAYLLRILMLWLKPATMTRIYVLLPMIIPTDR